MDTLREADALFKKREVDSALERYRAAAESGDERVRVEALSQVARCLSIQKKLDEAETVLGGVAVRPEEKHGWTRFLGVRGILERERGEKAKARATFEEMYDYSMSHDLPLRAIDAAHHVAIVGTPEEQIEWGRKGIAAAEAAEDDGWLAVLWNNLGATYDDLKRYIESLTCYRKAREYHHRTGTEHQKMVADWAVGHACRLVGQYGEAVGILERTLAQVEERHSKKADPESIEWVGWCAYDLGEACVGLGLEEDGLKLMRRGRDALVEAKISEWWPDRLKQINARLE